MNDWQAAAKHARATQQTKKLPGACHDRFLLYRIIVICYKKLFFLLRLIKIKNQSPMVSNTVTTKSIIQLITKRHNNV